MSKSLEIRRQQSCIQFKLRRFWHFRQISPCYTVAWPQTQVAPTPPPSYVGYTNRPFGHPRGYTRRLMMVRADILHFDVDTEEAGAESPVPRLLESRLQYGTGMRINAALKVFAEKRLHRKQRKLEVGPTYITHEPVTRQCNPVSSLHSWHVGHLDLISKYYFKKT